ncbi:hypothetical protein [Trinickia sp.]
MASRIGFISMGGTVAAARLARLQLADALYTALTRHSGAAAPR